MDVCLSFFSLIRLFVRYSYKMKLHTSLHRVWGASDRGAHNTNACLIYERWNQFLVTSQPKCVRDSSRVIQLSVTRCRDSEFNIVKSQDRNIYIHTHIYIDKRFNYHSSMMPHIQFTNWQNDRKSKVRYWRMMKTNQEEQHKNNRTDSHNISIIRPLNMYLELFSRLALGT